jgi:hypothetical protein
MMSWLDSVLTTPVFGLRLKPSLRTSLSYANLLGEFLDELLVSAGNVNIAQLQPVGLLVTLNDTGHRIRFEPANVVADFRYQLEGEVAAGELPAVKDPAVRPYSEVAQELIGLIAGAADCLAQQEHPLVCNRFGVVAQAWLKEKSAPPGVEKLKELLTGQWTRPVAKMESTAMTRLKEDEQVVEQCHHRLAFDETRQPGQLALSLDWQRNLKEPLTLGVGDTQERLVDNLEAALQYFESVADGGFNDA